MKKKSNPLPASVSAALDDAPSLSKTSSAKKNGKTNGKPRNGTVPTDPSLTDQLDNRELLKILSEVRQGNFSVRMPIDRIGMSGKICDTLNEIISLNETLVEELSQARNTIG